MQAVEITSGQRDRSVPSSHLDISEFFAFGLAMLGAMNARCSVGNDFVRIGVSAKRCGPRSRGLFAVVDRRQALAGPLLKMLVPEVGAVVSDWFVNAKAIHGCGACMHRNWVNV